MFKFGDFGINVENSGFEGEKIKIDKVLNKLIVIEDFKITESNYKDKGNGKLLTIQIISNDDKRVIFTGASGLQSQISQVPKDKFPFSATIVKINDRYHLT